MSSPSPQASTSSLLARQHQTLLTRLVSHFINAKQSLNSTEQIYRANEIVNAARSSVESIAIYCAGNKFLFRCAQKQMSHARQVRQALNRIKEENDVEFKNVLRELDAIDARTQKTLEVLKTTEIDLCFQEQAALARSPSSAPSASSEHGSVTSESGPPPRTLYDFVSERGVQELTRFFRDRIDEINAASADFADALKDFDERQQDLILILDSNKLNDDDVRSSNGRVVLAFRSLEAHAEDAAESLQSLVRHYDRCLEALKNTEGGAEAAAANVNLDAPLDLQTGSGKVTNPAAIVPKALSDAERAEMLQVLEQDALEVNDVVSEIVDHLREMELHFDQIEDHVTALKRERGSLTQAIESLDALGTRMAAYAQLGSDYLTVWTEQRRQIEEKMVELDAAHGFYEKFLRAYDGTVLEIHRRRHAMLKAESVVAEALTKLGKLYEEDLEHRQAYLEEHSDYIPSNLWMGVTEEPAKYQIARANKLGDDLPAVSKEAVQAALLRSKSANL